VCGVAAVLAALAVWAVVRIGCRLAQGGGVRCFVCVGVGVGGGKYIISMYHKKSSGEWYAQRRSATFGR